MAKIPFTAINDADFEANPELKPLIRAMNDRLRPLASALSNNITVADNMAGQYNEIELQIPPTGSTRSPYPISFSWDYQGFVPQGCLIVKIYSPGNRRTQISGVNPPDWDFGNGRIIINGIPGNLVASMGYIVRFYTFA